MPGPQRADYIHAVDAGPEGACIVEIESLTSHTQVHRLTRRLLEPAQNILVLAVGIVLFGLMVRTIAQQQTRNYPQPSRNLPKLNPTTKRCKLLKRLVGPQGFEPWTNGL
jgi:hypothetical protein